MKMNVRSQSIQLFILALINLLPVNVNGSTRPPVPSQYTSSLNLAHSVGQSVLPDCCLSFLGISAWQTKEQKTLEIFINLFFRAKRSLKGE